MTNPYLTATAAPYAENASKLPCSSCGRSFKRYLRDQESALETLCLCGHREYLDETGTLDGIWDTDNIMRLIVIDRRFMAHMHVFRDGEDGQRISQQVGDFILSASEPFRMLLPMDTYAGTVNPPSEITVALAEKAFNDKNQSITVCHHFPARTRNLNTTDYERSMLDKGELPYDHLDEDTQTEIAQLRGFASYTDLTHWQHKRMTR